MGVPLSLLFYIKYTNLMKSEDIARLAGVSRATVSRVINGKSDVSAATRERIQNIIKEYNFVPDQFARKLVGKVPEVLGLFIKERTPKDKNHIIPWKVHQIPYFGGLTLAIINRAKRLGYKVMVTIVSDYSEAEDMIISFRSRSIAGGVFLGFPENTPQIDSIVESGFPISLIDQQRVNTHENVVLVNVDDFTGGYKATKYVVDHGHTRIAHLFGNPKIISAQLRKEGFLSCLQDHNIEVSEDNLLPGAYDEYISYKATLKLLNRPKQEIPTAIFFANDLMAVGGYRAIHEKGLRIPEDISCIGYDGYPLEGVFHKPLSSMQGSLEELGSMGVDLLVDYIATGEPKPIYKVEPMLIKGTTVSQCTN